MCAFGQQRAVRPLHLAPARTERQHVPLIYRGRLQSKWGDLTARVKDIDIKVT